MDEKHISNRYQSPKGFFVGGIIFLFSRCLRIAKFDLRVSRDTAFSPISDGNFIFYGIDLTG